MSLTVKEREELAASQGGTELLRRELSGGWWARRKVWGEETVKRPGAERDREQRVAI